MIRIRSAFFLAFLAAAAARADVQVFTDEATFLAAAPISATETFDELPDMQVPVQLDVDNLRFVTRGIWQMPGTCSLERTLGANNIARRVLTFRAPGDTQGTVLAVGFRLITFAVFPPADYGVAIEDIDGRITTFLINDVVSGSPAYRGFLSSSPIKRMFINAIGSTRFNYCLDDVSRSDIVPMLETTPSGVVHEAEDADANAAPHVLND